MTKYSFYIFFIMTLFVPVCLMHNTLQAQDFLLVDENIDEENPKGLFSYRGIGASFGIKQFNIDSDLTPISGLAVTEEGGSVALVFGNSHVRFALRAAGLYYSNASVARTIDVFEVGFDANYYLLKAIKKNTGKVDIYVVSGISNQDIKFYGQYIEEDHRAGQKGGQGQEPYLGKVNTTSIDLGLGTEFRVKDEVDFVHFFAEARVGMPIAFSADIYPLDNTSITSTTSVNVGFRFGRKN